MFIFRKREKQISDAEKQIQLENKKFHDTANLTISMLQEVRKVVTDATITGKIYHATGGPKHGR